MKEFTVQEINSLVKGELIGDYNGSIKGLEQIENAGEGELTFIGNLKYSRKWEASKASIAIVYEGIKIEPGEGKAFIKVKNPDLAMAQVLEVFLPDPPHFDMDTMILLSLINRLFWGKDVG